MHSSAMRVAVALAVLTITSPATGLAQGIPADTAVAAVAGQYYTPPLLGVDADGEPHLLFMAAGAVHHAWRESGAWSREVVAASGSLADFVVSPTGVPCAAYLRPGGAVARARRIGGVWLEDTAAVIGGSVLALALALEPATEEPAIAILASPAADSVVLTLARHAAGAWTTALVDTAGSAQGSALVLALDTSGRPLVAWSRDGVTGPRGLVLAEGAGPLGPFTSAVVDTGYTWNVALALDPVTQAPRLAHYSYRLNDQGYEDPLVFYSWRHPTLGWQDQQIPGGLVSIIPRPVSLMLDPLGDPVVAVTAFNAIRPYGAQPATAQCGFVETGAIEVWTRLGGEGPQDFTQWASLRVVSALGSRRAVAATGVGTVQTAWREYHYTSVYCPPNLVWYPLARAVSVDPPIAPASSLRLEPPYPNPWAAGALTVSFALPRAATVALELHDVAGRRVAARAREAVAAGTHVRGWDPGPLAPGLYWLTLRADGARVASRALVVAR